MTTAGAAAGLVEAADVHLSFGGVAALEAVSVVARPQATVGIIGPNGAGKTSLLNCLNGFYRPQRGQVRIDGRVVNGMAPHRIAAMGVARTFQGMELVQEATVLENILLGTHVNGHRGVVAALVFWGPAAHEEVHLLEQAETVIEFLEIERLRHRLVGSLSAGQQKLVGLGRALASNPHTLLLDEPSAGMNREERNDVARFMLRIKHERPTTQILIEHDVRFVRDLCDYVYVLDFGTVIAQGKPEETLAHEAVIAAYTGIASQRTSPEGA